MSNVDDSEELYVDPIKLEKSRSIKPLLRVASAGSLFGTSNYPVQINPIDVGYSGEYRGTYANNYWNPKASRYGDVRQDRHGNPRALQLYPRYVVKLL